MENMEITLFNSGVIYDSRIIACVSLTLISLTTYFVTSINSSFSLRQKKRRKAPPGVPYWIPIVGNLFSFLWNRCLFLDKAVENYGYSTPLLLRLGPVKLYFVSGADHYLKLFSNRASRSTNTKAAVLFALENLFGTPKSILPFYAADNSGVNANPLPGTNVKPEHRITYFQARAAHRHLSGPGLAHMTELYLNFLKKRVVGDQIGSEWVYLPNLYQFLQVEVFAAAVEAMCGSYILPTSSTFISDFWEFVDTVPTLFKGLPRWMSPRPYRVRGRLLDAIKRWHKFAHEHSDCSKTGTEDPEWEPYFGSKLMRARQEYSRITGFMNVDALAAEDLGLLFATNTNSIPSLTWFIYEICRDPSLKSRVEKEIEVCRALSVETDEILFDINKLCSQPLLQSIYAETLRLRVALIVTRTPERKDLDIGDWVFPPDRVIAFSSRAGAMNPHVWNVGNKETPHPLDEFWAERFLIYPNDPTSGPCRKQVDDERCLNDGSVPSQTDPGEGPIFSMEGVTGGWIPYGGGQRMCPGRHFAKQEIIGTLALLLTYYEIELEVQKARTPKCDMKFFPFGGLPPTMEIPFRMRRRVNEAEN